MRAPSPYRTARGNRPTLGITQRNKSPASSTAVGSLPKPFLPTTVGAGSTSPTRSESVAGVFARGGMGVGFKCVRFSEREKEREKMGKGNYGVLATRKPKLLKREPGVT